jgi:hypothetical protein
MTNVLVIMEGEWYTSQVWMDAFYMTMQSFFVDFLVGFDAIGALFGAAG